ncbi:unnamed protein product, partial [Meganyctiphanes norvegica]
MSSLISVEATTRFMWADYAIFSILLLTSLIVGIISGRKGWKNGSTREFLLGNRNMNPIAVALSLMGGVVSAISVLGNSTEIYIHGTQLWMNLIGCFWGSLFVAFFVLPILYPLELISMYEYLDLRFKSRTLQKIGSMSQIINNVMYLGICLYAPSLTLSSVTELSLWSSICVLGVLCSIYITLGGVRAVVYTDVVQTSVMFIGVLVVIAQVSNDLGGINSVWAAAEKGGRLDFFNMDTSPFVRHTFWSVQVLGMYFITSTIGFSQPQYQRLVAVRSVTMSKLVLLSFIIGLTCIWSLFYYSGLVAYAAYKDCDPLTTGKIDKADQILVYMVGDKMGHLPGMIGLFVAAVAGAVLSSMSSVASGLAAMIWEDFLKGFWIFKDMDSSQACNVTRGLSLAAGLLSIVMATLISKLGTLFQAAYSISGAIASPLDGIFIAAMAFPWVNRTGAVAGFLSAFGFNIWFVISKFYLQAGQTKPLPMSTEDCVIDETLSNSDMEYNFLSNNSSFLMHTINNSTQEIVQEHVKERDYLVIFDVSYCYLGSIGIIIVLVVSTLVSLITGMVPPSEVKAHLVDKRCFRAYKWIWSICKGKEDSYNTDQDVQIALTSNSKIEIVKNSTPLPEP